MSRKQHGDRIGDYVTSGELSNTSRNSITGYIDFAPDWGIRISLNGNFHGPFAGKRFRFRCLERIAANVAIDDLPAEVHVLADDQIGEIGVVELRQVRLPTQ